MDAIYGFKNVTQLGQSLISDQLESNVYCWLNWGLLGVGAFTSVTLNSNSPHGSIPQAKLRPTLDPRYPVATGKCRIFEANRSDWVWESGIPYAQQPTQISGVYVDNTFVPSSSTGTYAHQILYPEGRVLFNTPIPSGSDVRLEYSYKQVHVRRANEPWFQTLMVRSYRSDEDFQSPPGSGGAWDILSQNRVQLPAYIIEPVNRVKLTPYEIGNTARIHEQDMFVHVMSETPWDARRLHDILIEQYDKRIPSFDRNQVTFPLDAKGALVAGAKTYPEMVADSPWRQIRIKDVHSTPQEDLGNKLYWTTVRFKLEIDAP